MNKLSTMRKEVVRAVMPFSSNEEAIAGVATNVVMTPATTKAYADESIVLDHNTLTNYEAERHRLTTVADTEPTGGTNGDVWLQY